MNSPVEQRIIGMLDALIRELVDFRSEFAAFRAEMNKFFAEIVNTNGIDGDSVTTKKSSITTGVSIASRSSSREF
jgi:hypothetical protein